MRTGSSSWSAARWWRRAGTRSCWTGRASTTRCGGSRWASGGPSRPSRWRRGAWPWRAPPATDRGRMARTVLVFRVGQLGDTLIALPAIEAIRRRHPDDRLVLLTDRHPSDRKHVSSWEVLGPTGCFDSVLHYRPVRGAWR